MPRPSILACLQRWSPRAALLVLVPTVVLAQPAPAADTTKAAGSEVELSIAPEIKLSPEEMIVQATALRKRMDEGLMQIQTLVEQARKAKDVIKVTCVTSAQIRGKANVDIADGAIKALNDAAGRRDLDACKHEFTRVSIIHQKIQVLAGDAQGCIGEEVNFVGKETQRTTDIDPNLVPAKNFTKPDGSKTQDGVGNRPSAASPFE